MSYIKPLTTAVVLETEYEALRAELEAAQRDLRLCRGEDTAEKYRAAMAEIETLRADAFRYRWICRFPEDAEYSLTSALNRSAPPGDGPPFSELLSRSIDVALAALAAKGEK